MTEQPEAHPVRVEYVVERALSGDRWVEESIAPAPTAEAAEAEAAWCRRPECTYRTVQRTITSTVVAERPAQQQGEQP